MSARAWDSWVNATLVLRGLGPTETLPAFWELVARGSNHLWGHCTIENAKTLFIYMPTLIYVYESLKSLYKTARERRKRRRQQIDELQHELSMLELQLAQYRADCEEKRAALKVRTERFLRLRRRVREQLASSRPARACLKECAIWDDVALGGGGDDTNTLSEMLQKLNYEQTILPGKWRPSPQPSASSGSGAAARRRRERAGRAGAAPLCRLFAPRHAGRLKRHEVRAKKTENIKKLLQDWQESLSSVIDKKLEEHQLTSRSQLDVPSAEINYDVYSTKMLTSSQLEVTSTRTDCDIYRKTKIILPHDIITPDGKERDDTKPASSIEQEIKQIEANYDIYHKLNYQCNSSEDSLQDVDYYGQSWSDYPYQQCPRPEPVTLLEVSLQPPQCECGGPQGSKVLFMLPEETTSQIEISEVQK